MPQPSLIERGFAPVEEYKRLYRQIGFTSFQSEARDETFWGIKLNDEYFVFGNNTLEFWGHNIIGRVGIHKNGVVDRTKTVEYFMKIDERKK